MSRRNPESTEPVNKDPENPTVFGPVVSPAVVDPAARRYAAQIAERKGPPRYTQPVAGGKGPPIPRLDQPAADGSTMADQANAQRMPERPPAPGGIFAGSAPPSSSAGPVPMQQRPAGLLPSDILPEAAKQDPDFREGQGSMYALAQPKLAFKYGVVRNGKHIPAQSLGQQQRGLRPESLKDLQTLASLQPGAPPPPAGRTSEDMRIEQEAAAGSAGAAGRLGNAPGDGPQAAPGASQENLKEAVKKLDDFDFSTFRDMMMKDIINNDDQREIIEKRCPPLDVMDLVMRGFITQRVPIIPGKLEPEFQSIPGTEDLAIKRLVMSESKGIEVSDRYLLDKFALMGLTLGLRAINNNVIPDHHDSNGVFDEELFWKKFNYVARYPTHMLSSFGVNYFWFDIRVRKLFVAEKLGNG